MASNLLAMAFSLQKGPSLARVAGEGLSFRTEDGKLKAAGSHGEQQDVAKSRQLQSGRTRTPVALLQPLLGDIPRNTRR